MIGGHVDADTPHGPRDRFLEFQDVRRAVELDLFTRLGGGRILTVAGAESELGLPALMGMNMLVETVGGRNYADAEYADWLTGAGFTEIRTVRFDAPGANGAVLGVKP